LPLEVFSQRNFVDLFFRDGGRRHLGFLKSQIYNGCATHDGRSYITVPNFVEIGQTVAEIWRFFSIFRRWGLFAILDLLCAGSVHPLMAFSALYCCAKYGWNRHSSFDNNMRVLDFVSLA